MWLQPGVTLLGCPVDLQSSAQAEPNVASAMQPATRAEPAAQLEQDVPSNASGSDADSPQEAMDLQQALKIVEKHYHRKTACLLFLPLMYKPQLAVHC